MLTVIICKESLQEKYWRNEETLKLWLSYVLHQDRSYFICSANARRALKGIPIRFISWRCCPDDAISDSDTNFTVFCVTFHQTLARRYGRFFEKGTNYTAYLPYQEIQTVLYYKLNRINNRAITYLYMNELDNCLSTNHSVFISRRGWPKRICWL